MTKNIFYSLKEDDEYYTPRYEVEPLLEFLPNQIEIRELNK